MSKDKLDFAFAAQTHEKLTKIEFYVCSLLSELNKKGLVESDHFKRLTRVQEALEAFEENLEPALFLKGGIERASG